MPKCDTYMTRPLQGNLGHTSSYRYVNCLWNVQWRLAASGHAMPCSALALHGLGCFVTGQSSCRGWGIGGGRVASAYCYTGKGIVCYPSFEVGVLSDVVAVVVVVVVV